MIPFPAKKYNVIYADPPWAFRVWSEKGKERSADKHYSCMTLDDLKQMPVNSITAGDGCALFMWATFPMLREALELIEAWGFEYKTIAFCWVKQNKNSDGIFKGMGYYTRFGDLPRIELFARETTPGWDCWGNEVPQIQPQQGETT